MTKIFIEIVHTDLHGPLPCSRSGYQYWMCFVDDNSRYKAAIPLKHKSDASKAFKQYKAWAENLTGQKIKSTQDDKGGEFISNEWKEYNAAEGIHHRHSTRNRPQQNGVAERTNRILDERITCMLIEAGLPKMFWVECLTALIHVLNRCPTSALKDDVTPYEVFYGTTPGVEHLRVWGCLAYVHVQKDKRGSLGSHMEKCIFIGYPDGYKAWKFYNPVTKKIIICERADFDERYNFYGAPLEPKPVEPVSKPSEVENKRTVD